jgi:glycerophosphoryl diester phosphodiesterase
MFECDVKLSADGVPFLMHDASLARTTNAASANFAPPSTSPSTSPTNPLTTAPPSNIGGHHPWATLAQLDAGSWHSRAFAGEPLPTLANTAAFCLQNGYFLNIEIKPTPGSELETGRVVAEHASRLWRTASTPPLLSSFSPQALEGAQQTAPQLPRALLLDTLIKGWLETALMLDCVAIVCNHALWDTSTVLQAKSAGFKTLSYTVNDEWAAERLIALGTDGIITDRVDLFAPAAL